MSWGADSILRSRVVDMSQMVWGGAELMRGWGGKSILMNWGAGFAEI